MAFNLFIVVYCEMFNNNMIFNYNLKGVHASFDSKPSLVNVIKKSPVRECEF